MKKALWLGALLGSTVIGTVPALAQDAGGAAASSADTSAQIQALQAQLQELQNRLNKLETAPPPPPPAAPAPVVKLPDWISDTKISGKGYINLSTIHQQSNGVDAPANGTQAELKRFYISVDHKFSNIFSADLTTDVRYGTNGLTNDDAVYVKKAYLEAKLAPEFWVRVGAADLPWVPYVEGLYNYRFVENVVIDRTKYGTSADWGLHVGGTFGKGLVGYQISAVGGQGYKTISRSTDTVDLEGRLDVHPIKGVTLAVGGYTGKLGKSTAGLVNTPHRATRFDALVAYTAGPVRAGVEYFTAKNWNNVTSATADKTEGWSFFGSYAFNKQFAAFGRYDRVNPNKYTDAPAKENYFNVGLDYTGVKNIDIALVYKRDAVYNIAAANFNTSNGKIGGPGATNNTADGTYDEFGVWTQFKF